MNLDKLEDTIDEVIRQVYDLPDSQTANEDVNVLFSATTYRENIHYAYEKMVHWKKNLFELPKGKCGNIFINEMTKLINDWSLESSDRDVSLTALMTMPSLILQKTSSKCKNSEMKQHIERRIDLWKKNEIELLVDECITIQNRLPNRQKPLSIEELSKRFAKLMLQGKVNPALRLLDENTKGVLTLSDDVMKILREKHPDGCPINENMLLHGPQKLVTPVIYDEINAELIRRCAFKMKGSHGPSGLDSEFWRKLLSNKRYGSSADDLCHAIALLTRKLCSYELQDPLSIEPLQSCRLIPLDKSPGVRPIGIGEVLRRIIGKAVMKIIKPDILEATAYQQFCAGQEAGCEVAIHTVRQLFEDDSNHGIIQIDARNAFNTLNRNLLLHNIRIICPEAANYVINCYSGPARLFVTGGKELKSNEGTTQGDPISMGMYAIGLMPLLTTLAYTDRQIHQIAFADDVTAVGTISQLKQWWNNIICYGPLLGYHVNESKSWLIVKGHYLQEAQEIFKDSQIGITDQGNRHLGAVVGTNECKNNFMRNQVNTWIDQLTTLSVIARTQPHAAFTAFIHGLVHRYTFIMRTIPDISQILKPLDDAIDSFIRVLFQNFNFNKAQRKLFSLPAKFGGMNIIIPSEKCDEIHEQSKLVTKNAVEKTICKESYFVADRNVSQKLKSEIKNEKMKKAKFMFDQLKSEFTDKEKLRCVEAASENGASIWLTVLPIKENGFFLEKQAFWDAIRIRYNIPLERMPSSCVCGNTFDIQHALSCPKGGLIINRHNEIRDLTHDILDNICSTVIREPLLTPLTGERFDLSSAVTSAQARTDVSARGFWIRGQMAHCDIRVFNPLAKVHLNQSLSAVHRKNENEKKRCYNQRILEVEHGSFTPLVFSCFGGMSRECSRFFSHAAELLAEKRGEKKSEVSAWIKTRLNFALVKSCLLCIRGRRSSFTSEKLENTDIHTVMFNSNFSS